MVRKRIRARGIVQGVGFRPFVYRLARECGLAGWVANSSAGVTVEIEGGGEAVARFLEAFRGQAPALAQIDDLSVEALAVTGGTGFTIRESGEAGADAEFVLVPPDVATCDDCLRDFTDPSNRRYLYPFTNCTNCGPRYTIIEDIPYDRPATTMSVFPMCPECQFEYEDPADRRFHAQPNACPVCGPRLDLPLEEVHRLLRDGRIVAIKGLGGFHLACDAENDAAVRQLRERKRRSDKPFALMARDLPQIERICLVSDAERTALTGPRRPIVILKRRPDAALSATVAPGNDTVGVMLPYTPLHHLLFADDLNILVMTSGNISEEPIVSRNEDAPTRLGGIADAYLTHNRAIRTRVDDSVVRVYAGRERVLRRSRGFAPLAIDLGMPVRQVLAVGAELKNTFCLTKDHYAIPSQHIGDLENYETLEFFEETLAHTRRFFRVEPEAVAHDLHPGYLSTRIAHGMEGLPHIGVQHHHAHIAACMAENHLCENVIGVAFDGTGYGTDGQLWGGEFLVCNFGGFERRAHFRYVPMAGGDQAIREPWRMAIAWLRETFGSTVPELPFLAAIPERRRAVVEAMLTREIQTVATSSCGRLFDAVAAIAGVRLITSFEGQAAIELECIAAPGEHASYPFEADLDFRPAIAEIVADVRKGVSNAVISGRFHETIAAAVAAVCQRIRASEGLGKICLSGGTFQNRRLTERCLDLLSRLQFEVFLHAQVPPNDGGISLGQAVIASHRN